LASRGLNYGTESSVSGTRNVSIGEYFPARETLIKIKRYEKDEKSSLALSVEQMQEMWYEYGQECVWSHLFASTPV
jgi:hypothetical protein